MEKWRTFNNSQRCTNRMHATNFSCQRIARATRDCTDLDALEYLDCVLTAHQAVNTLVQQAVTTHCEDTVNVVKWHLSTKCQLRKYVVLTLTCRTSSSQWPAYCVATLIMSKEKFTMALAALTNDGQFVAGCFEQRTNQVAHFGRFFLSAKRIDVASESLSALYTQRG